jgi:6-phosphogluconolactonase
VARLYAVDESDPGSVAAFEILDGALVRTGSVSSGGSSPCHLYAHPGGGWLYTTNYGDGVATALALDAAGDLTGESEVLPHSGSGPNTERQERSHAHSSWVSPGGGWLVVADLGTDELRAYRLEDGRPVGAPVLTAMTAGSGPRHAVVAGDLIHVACELSCEVVTLRWDEAGGRAEMLGSVAAVTLPPRTGDEHTLSHLELVDEQTLVVGVRGADSLAVVGLVDGVVDRLLAEILTVAWPRHLAVVDGAVLVAGERADLIGVHPVAPGSAGASVGELTQSIAAPAPMCLLPVR